MSLLGRLGECRERKRGNRLTDRQTDRQAPASTTTVTLAAHARRGLTTAWGEPEKTIMSLHRKIGFVAEVVLKEETVAFSRVTVSRENCTVWTHTVAFLELVR